MLIGLLMMLGGLFLMYWGWTGLQGNSKQMEILPKSAIPSSNGTV